MTGGGIGIISGIAVNLACVIVNTAHDSVIGKQIMPIANDNDLRFVIKRLATVVWREFVNFGFLCHFVFPFLLGLKMPIV